jgi:hypothetical protein
MTHVTCSLQGRKEFAVLIRRASIARLSAHRRPMTEQVKMQCNMRLTNRCSGRLTRRPFCCRKMAVAVLVSNVGGMKEEFEGKGAKVGNWRVDERDGKRFQVFFVVAPDGLCYYFHEPIGDAA